MCRNATSPNKSNSQGEPKKERTSTSTARTASSSVTSSSVSSQQSIIPRSSSTDSADGSGDNNNKPKYYQLDVANLPDSLFHAHVPVEKWLDTCTTTCHEGGFPPNSLNRVHSIPWFVELERIVGFTLYQFMNVLPFLLVPLAVLYFGIATTIARGIVLFVIGYVSVLLLLTALLEPVFLYKYRQNRFLLSSMKDVQRNQYVYTERNTTKYLSVKFIWPASIQRPSFVEDTSVIFCIVPHGVVSWGIAAYPLWSKVWNNRICRWSIAPIVLKIPIVRYLAKMVGYIPAKAQPILETLLKRNENVGLVLDGIAGMFSGTSDKSDPNVETAFLKQRKGVVKIALKAGVPIIPVYGFGHTSLYTVCVDPMGLLEYISSNLQISLTPFLGRWNWILGPPKRVPVTVCLGQPIRCPQVDHPSQLQIDHYHSLLLDSYKELFETHKVAYGWGHKKLRFV